MGKFYGKVFGLLFVVVVLLFIAWFVMENIRTGGQFSLESLMKSMSDGIQSKVGEGLNGVFDSIVDFLRGSGIVQ